MKRITFIASGLGITAILQVLRNILSSKDSSVSFIDLVWINEEINDFVCDKIIEDFEYLYYDKVMVTRILEEDLFGKGLSKLPDFFKVIHSYESASLAIICAPDYILSRSRSVLFEMGYPTDSVLSIIMS